LFWPLPRVCVYVHVAVYLGSTTTTTTAANILAETNMSGTRFGSSACCTQLIRSSALPTCVVAVKLIVLCGYCAGVGVVDCVPVGLWAS